MRSALTATRILVLPTLALVFVAVFVPGRLEIATRVYALLVAATALGMAYAALRRAYPHVRPLRRATAPRPERARPVSLVRLENELTMARSSELDLHFRLVPRLCSLAEGLLASRRGISLQRSPDAAREVLGPDAWGLVRPDQVPPADRTSRGATTGELTRAVDALERI
jgi:hypothetical protein